MKRFLHLLGEFLEDFFIFAGIIVAILTTYALSPIIGNYLLASCLIVTGGALARRR
ncbi:hypothetical protein ACFFJY_08020 [Fictibacillus aquaticus]|uniref:hypothetical protein n=1 Tax=Fictibacillus aquaticus TaxID=2021314 RepID=UPI0013FD6632|nr:hypothetical protein [Fictibacillus aquaticus]